MPRLIQITDMHLFAEKIMDYSAEQTPLSGVKPYPQLAQIIAKIKSQAPLPDAVLLTGDISQDISVASYHHVVELIEQLGITTYFIPGNHDSQENIRILLQSSCIDSSRLIYLANWALILLDSTMPDRISGWLRDEELNFLKESLEKTRDYQVLIALHHHPLPMQSAAIDKYILENREQFLEIVQAYAHVKLVVFGHVHQEFQQVVSGINYLACPATSVQFLPYAEEFAIDYARTPGCRWLDLLPTGFSTGVIRT